MEKKKKGSWKKLIEKMKKKMEIFVLPRSKGI
jgi:hypothetical protein